MGLDFSHSAARWSYGGFARFRNRLAVQVGIYTYETINNIDDIAFDSIKNDPIKYLLAHSDCDGHITPTRCRKLAPRLRELIANWPDDRDKQNAALLADGMEEAAAENKPLRFI